MPEGDTIAYAAERMRPVLVGAVPDKIVTPQARHRLDRWPERLGGRAVTGIRTHGKHLFICFGPLAIPARHDRAEQMSSGYFDGDLVIHSHLRMTGAWGIYPEGRRWHRAARRAWVVFESRGHEVVEFDGPVLELMTAGRARLDQRVAALGPDVLAPEFDSERFLARLRSDDQTRAIGDALLDQRNVAGIGNAWKAEGCWAAAIDPWRPVASVSDAEALAVIGAVRPGMLESARHGHVRGRPSVYRQAGRPCPRCGSRIRVLAGGLGRSPSGLAQAGPAPRRPAGDDNRTTFWCPGCQL